MTGNYRRKAEVQRKFLNIMKVLETAMPGPTPDQ
jgi:hypothetical protein